MSQQTFLQNKFCYRPSKSISQVHNWLAAASSRQFAARPSSAYVSEYTGAYKRRRRGVFTRGTYSPCAADTRTAVFDRRAYNGVSRRRHRR